MLAAFPRSQQALHWAWRRNERLWLLATPAAAFAALELGALVEAARAFRHLAPHPQGSTAGWITTHYEAAALALAALNAIALAGSTACLLAAAFGLGAGTSRMDREASEPLLGGEEGRRKRRRGRASPRMRLIYGTLKYVVPDTLQLKIRCVSHRRGA